MPSWNFTLNLGSNDEGETRRKAYEKAAAKKDTSLTDWAKRVLDAAAGIKIVVKED